jgi:hypothetical protein
VVARGGSIGLLEGLEEATHLFASEPDAGVTDREANQLAVSIFFLYTGFYDDLAPLGELDRVIAKIDQDLPQSQRVDVLRHVAFWNQYVADSARGRKGADTANEIAFVLGNLFGKSREFLAHLFPAADEFG